VTEQLTVSDCDVSLQFVTPSCELRMGRFIVCRNKQSDQYFVAGCSLVIARLWPRAQAFPKEPHVADRPSTLSERVFGSNSRCVNGFS
jgi:hypothetical protein